MRGKPRKLPADFFETVKAQLGIPPPPKRRRKVRKAGARKNHICNNGWICVEHLTQGWPHADCPGPGMPCPVCHPGEAEGLTVEWA